MILSLGGLFFSIYFGFPSIRKFGLALRVVQGKYDDIESGAKEVHPEANLNTVDGDIVDTIKVEHHHGEVSHFQALATAVSGTVGLGNIAGVTIAISLGWAWCYFLDDCKWIIGYDLKICGMYIRSSISRHQ
jgi:AGCS family alanine or glycine:cation symporter